MPGYFIGQPKSQKPEDLLVWLKNSVHHIERVDRSRADIAIIAQDYTLTNYTELRSLDGTAGTLDDVRNFLCTFVDDIKRRGREGRD